VHGRPAYAIQSDPIHQYTRRQRETAFYSSHGARNALATIGRKLGHTGEVRELENSFPDLAKLLVPPVEAAPQCVET
jgi:hypothetical protein